jgi:hypothetical protein
MASFANELRGLIGLLTEAGPPTGADLRVYFGSRGLAIKEPGPNLERPAWARIVTPEDRFVDLTGGVAGVRFGDDPRGYGAYAEISVTNGSLEEVEEITGPLAEMQPRRPLHPGPPARSSQESLFVRVEAGEHRAAVYVVHEGGAVKAVTIQF